MVWEAMISVISSVPSNVTAIIGDAAAIVFQRGLQAGRIGDDFLICRSSFGLVSAIW